MFGTARMILCNVFCLVCVTNSTGGSASKILDLNISRLVEIRLFSWKVFRKIRSTATETRACYGPAWRAQPRPPTSREHTTRGRVRPGAAVEPRGRRNRRRDVQGPSARREIAIRPRPRVVRVHNSSTSRAAQRARDWRAETTTRPGPPAVFTTRVECRPRGANKQGRGTGLVKNAFRAPVNIKFGANGLAAGRTACARRTSIISSSPRRFFFLFIYYFYNKTFLARAVRV